MKRIIAFTLACLLASPAWAGDFPNPGSASHRARDDGWIDIDNLPFLCDDAHGRGAYNICKENGNGSGLILHEKESIGEGELLTFLNDAANQAVGMALGGGGEFFIQHFANLHFYENGGEDIVFNEGSIALPGNVEFDFENGLTWPDENMELYSADDNVLQLYGDNTDILQFKPYRNVTGLTDDVIYALDVHGNTDADNEISAGGYDLHFLDATDTTVDTDFRIFTTIGDVGEYRVGLRVGSGVIVGDPDLLVPYGGSNVLIVSDAGDDDDTPRLWFQNNNNQAPGAGSADKLGTINVKGWTAGAEGANFEYGSIEHKVYDFGDGTEYSIWEHWSTVEGSENIQMIVGAGVSIGDTDLEPDEGWIGMQASTGITSAVHGPFILYFPGDNTNNDNDSTLRLEARTTNGSFGADGMGSNIDFYAENASGSAVQQATITSEWDGTPTAGAVYGKMRFGMIRNSAYVTEMRIANGVTIGDVVPDDGQGTLLVVDGADGGEINLSDNDDQNLKIHANNGSGNADIEYVGGPLVINTVDAEVIKFATTDTDRWYIAANGSFYSAAATGGECGAGCINADEMRVDDDPVKVAGYQHMALMAGAGTVPAGGGIAGCTPVSAFDSGSNDIFLRQCSFSASADNAIYFTVPFPESSHLATDLDVYVRWTSATTTDGSDAVIWNATAVCFSDDDSINANAFPAVDAVTDTQTAAGDILSTATGGSAMSLTPAGSPTDFDTCVIRVSRDADNGSDTFNGTADLISVDLYYVDDLANED